MRLLLILLLLTGAASVNAQTILPGAYINQFHRPVFASNGFPQDSTTGNKKWYVSKYIGISSGISFFNGGHATILYVPVGVQINRKLTNNWYAFAGVSAAPAYINFNQAFLNSNNKTWQPNNSFSSSQLGIYSRAEMGLMYTNDQKTFSISGSIGIERSAYPMVNQVNAVRPHVAGAPNKY